MAYGIAFALGNSVGSLVKGFCAANPLPPLALSVSPVDLIDDDFTFGGLLKAIVKTKATDLLLVVHGHIDGTGLYLPVARGAPDVTGKRLEILTQVTSGKSLSDKQAAEFGSDPKAAPDLLDLMKKVRAMKLNTIEWRACDMGKNPGVLKQFLDFFGAKSMGAPVMANNFGIAGVSIRPFNQIPDK